MSGSPLGEPLSNLNHKFERVRGIEPLSLPWEGSVEPLNYTRLLRGHSLSKYRSFYLGIESVLPAKIKGLPFGSLPTLLARSIKVQRLPSPYIFSAIVKRVSPLSTL